MNDEGLGFMAIGNHGFPIVLYVSSLLKKMSEHDGKRGVGE